MANSTRVTVFSATAATPDLAIVEGQITTTSNQIAEHFGKRHDSVLRSIANLDCSPQFNARNFVAVEYTDAKGEKRPAYRMTRNGFTFLAMGFTGKDAALWKEAYIEAFNRMEEELLARTTRPFNPAIDYERISPAQAQDLKEIVNAIVRTGSQKHDETWARLHSKFRINAYKELPATRYEDARKYLIAKLPSGYADELVVDEAPKPTSAPQLISYAARSKAAFDAGTSAAAHVQRTVFEAVLNGDDNWHHQRLLLAFGSDSTSAAPACVQRIESGSIITTWSSLTDSIRHGECLQSATELLEMAAACMQRLHSRQPKSSKPLFN